jgi:hypothetical protein
MSVALNIGSVLSQNGISASLSPRTRAGSLDSSTPAPGEAPGGFDSEIYAIYLLRAHQGRGTGPRCFVRPCSGWRKRAFKKMFLWVLAENPTRRFYERMGGVELGSKATELGEPSAMAGVGLKGLFETGWLTPNYSSRWRAGLSIGACYI